MYDVKAITFPGPQLERRTPAGASAGSGLRRSVLATLLAAISAMSVASIVLSGAVSAAERSEGSPVEMAVTVVRTKNACFMDTIQVTGVLAPRNETLVRPDREGWQISQVLVEPGDAVVSGQVLARLTPPEGQPGGGGTTAVQAPTAGVITSRAAVVGTTASARAEPLFRIAAKGEMELLAETPVKTLGRIALDQSAKVEIVGVGELSGKVRLLSTAINPTMQLGQVRILVGSDPRLRVGAFGRATINIGRRCGPSIPLSAVLYGPGGAVVQVVRDRRIETRRVSVGLVTAGQAEIREGISEGDMVVARAGAFVREGERVRPILPAEPTARR
jgi:multidrug efflux pump subunit AcrA (membrane-fusion protein)